MASGKLAGLARAAGAEVVLRATQERRLADAATFIGRGKAEMLAVACAEANVDVVIVDNELTPAQSRNLEELLGRRVIDRTELILDIFARRARTREGQLQVELAQLQYRLPRLAGSSEKRWASGPMSSPAFTRFAIESASASASASAAGLASRGVMSTCRIRTCSLDE